MSEVRPFAALRFARDPEPRIAPPWDVISEADRARFGAEPENIVHLTLPPGPEGARDYAAARTRLERWRREGVLVRDASPALYTLAERTPRGRLRRGFFAELRLADYAERAVLPHERTMPKAKQDRLLLTREVRANLEPLFFLYEDRDGRGAALLDAAAQAEALARPRGPDGSGLELRAIRDGALVAGLERLLADRPVVIADGHHRYETMLAYRDERRAAAGRIEREAPFEFVLGYFVNAFDPGTEIRAIHRVLRGASAAPRDALARAGFAVEDLGGAPADALLERLASRRKDAHAYAFASASGALLGTRARGPRLDVEVLHDELLAPLGGALGFDAEPDRVLATARSETGAWAVFLNPLEPGELFRVVASGAVLPQKSTYFAPKVPSGLVLRSLDAESR
jgi:uncharacterized protein (DUF1015 family)